MKFPCIKKLVLDNNKLVKGFRAINLLVIFGILAGNTSSVLSQVSNTSGAEGEAKQYIGSMLRAQQAFYLENNAYATSISELGLGNPKETNNYRYVIVSYNDPTIVQISVRPRGVWRLNGITYGSGSNNKAVIGGVATITVGSYTTTISKMCVAILTPQQGGRLGYERMLFSPTGPSCPAGYK